MTCTYFMRGCSMENAHKWWSWTVRFDPRLGLFGIEFWIENGSHLLTKSVWFIFETTYRLLDNRFIQISARCQRCLVLRIASAVQKRMVLSFDLCTRIKCVNVMNTTERGSTRKMHMFSSRAIMITCTMFFYSSYVCTVFLFSHSIVVHGKRVQRTETTATLSTGNWN